MLTDRYTYAAARVLCSFYDLQLASMAPSCKSFTQMHMTMQASTRVRVLVGVAVVMAVQGMCSQDSDVNYSSPVCFVHNNFRPQEAVHMLFRTDPVQAPFGRLRVLRGP